MQEERRHAHQLPDLFHHKETQSMKSRMLLALAGIAAVFPLFAFSQEQAKRPEWDQKKAVEAVRRVTQLEQNGQPWDRIAWTTNVDEAVTRAQTENKPIFVFFYLQKNVGPAAAPC
jgi:hypothetical protein